MSPARKAGGRGGKPGAKRSGVAPKGRGAKALGAAPKGRVAKRSGAAPKGRGAKAPAAPKGRGAKAPGAAPKGRGGRASSAASASRRSSGARNAPDTPDARRSPERSGPGRVRRGDAAERGVGGEQVEGLHAVRELLLVGRRAVRELLIASERRDRGDLDGLTELAVDLGVAVTPTSTAKLERIARTEAHQGVVALAEPLPEADLDDLLRARATPPFLLLLDGVTDPGNLGAVLRSAECAGVTGVILPRHRAVHVTPAATKTAAGAIEHLPIALVGGLPAAIATLRGRGVWVVGLDAGGSTTVGELPAFDGPVALVLGSEGRGLSRLVRERVDVVASIPLHGQLESLNVAAAGAVAFYEIARRRGELA